MFQWTRESVNILNIEKLHQGKQTCILSILPENNQKEKAFVVFKRLEGRNIRLKWSNNVFLKLKNVVHGNVALVYLVFIYILY